MDLPTSAASQPITTAVLGILFLANFVQAITFIIYAIRFRGVSRGEFSELKVDIDRRLQGLSEKLNAGHETTTETLRDISTSIGQLQGELRARFSNPGKH